MRTLLLFCLALALTGCATQSAPIAVPPPVDLTSAAVPPPSSSSVSPTPEPESRPSVVTPPPCGPRVRACVSLSGKQAWLLKDGVVEFGPVPITHGMAGHRTPAGTFPVAWKDAVHTSSIYRTPMPHSVFFAPGGIAFHEGPLTEESHGCVHLSPEAAKVFFDGLPVRATVQIVA